jgi:glycine/D-amino acid oxidase-like deaminating enzyme
MKNYHTVVIGGGCLGTASAISLAKHMKLNHLNPESVCLVEKNLLSSALSIKHSGIIRSANSDPAAAELAKISSEMWFNIRSVWDTELNVEKNGALWIAKKDQDSTNAKWDKLAKILEDVPIAFKKIPYDEARQICPDYVNLHNDEVFYHEPNACQIDPSEVRQALYRGINSSGASYFENEEVMGFRKNKNNKITEVVLNTRVIKTENVVNAAGAWSPRLYQNLGLTIPVGVEPVFVVNWLNSLLDDKKNMPIIADYANRGYFRSWRNGEIHMHQPRKRGVEEASTLFADNPLAIIGADFINNPFNQMQGFSNIRLYEDIAHKRFKDLQNTVFSSGFQSYFDITPDLRFILGQDSKITNLFHCLGSGQAFKYAPVFGEMMVEYIFKPGKLSSLGDNFLIDRFDSVYMKRFWDNVSGKNYTLGQENVNF